MNDIDDPSNDEDRNDSWTSDKNSEKQTQDVQNSNEER